MERDFRNRFDELNPFNVLRAEDFGGDLYHFYQPLEDLIRKVSGVDIRGSRPVFLIGGRGTGKTMVLKSLSIDMQLKQYIKYNLLTNKEIEELSQDEIINFLDKINFIGIYSRFRTVEYDTFKNDFSFLFKPYLAIKLSEQLFLFLRTLKKINIINKKTEKLITTYFYNCIKYPKNAYNADFENALKFIKDDVLELFEIIKENIYLSIEEIKIKIGFPTILSDRIIFNFSDLIFKEIKYLNGKHLFILLDELEFLNEFHERRIGELIRASDETSVIFKIGSRYMPNRIYVGDSNEVLQEPDDIKIINITESMNSVHGRKTEYRNLIKNILNKRINNSKYFLDKGITDIYQLFPNYSKEDEACNLVNNKENHWRRLNNIIRSEEQFLQIKEKLKYKKNPIIEKLNMLLYYRGYDPNRINNMMNEYLEKKNKKYSRLYSKNSLNLLFQLHNDYRSEKKYVGFDVFVHLSSGIIRNAIEICNEALNAAYNYGHEIREKNPVPNEFQDFGAKYHAKIKYEDILRMPSNLNLDVQDFIKQLGTIFRALHLNPFLVEPEPTHFETHYLELNDDARKIFNATLQYSHIQKKPSMQPKRSTDAKREDYLLNRVYAPFFKISYNVRGRTIFVPSDLNTLILGNFTQKDETRKKIIRMNSKRRFDHEFQRTLTEYWEIEEIEIDS